MQKSSFFSVTSACTNSRCTSWFYKFVSTLFFKLGNDCCKIFLNFMKKKILARSKLNSFESIISKVSQK